MRTQLAAQAVPLDLARPFQLSFGGKVQLLQTGVFSSPTHPDCLVFFYEEKGEDQRTLPGRLIVTDRFGIPTPGTGSSLPYDGRIVNKTSRKTGYYGIYTDPNLRIDDGYRTTTNIYLDQAKYLKKKAELPAANIVDCVATWNE